MAFPLLNKAYGESKHQNMPAVAIESQALLVKIANDVARKESEQERSAKTPHKSYAGLSQPGNGKAKKVEMQALPDPAEVFEKLLEAEVLVEALKQYEDRLDSALLDLVKANALHARTDGDEELAEGLDSLADYIEQVVASRVVESS